MLLLPSAFLEMLGLTPLLSDTIFLLSGLVNVILFTTTRRVLPPQSILGRFSISRPSFLGGSTIMDSDSEKGTSTMDEKTMVSDAASESSVSVSMKPRMSGEYLPATRPPPAPLLYDDNDEI
jgi:hypothetical protein